MAIIGAYIDRTNPSFSIADFTFWMPQFKKFMQTEDGQTYFNKLYPLMNDKIFKSVYGGDWELAISLAIAHYLKLIADAEQAPSGDSLQTIAGGGSIKGVLASASVGSFSKSYDIDKTVSSEKEALFWNQTAYGAELMALLQTKALPSIFVVTSNPIGGGH